MRTHIGVLHCDATTCAERRRLPSNPAVLDRGDRDRASEGRCAGDAPRFQLVSRLPRVTLIYVNVACLGGSTLARSRTPGEV